jgi:hypothetical protein
MILVCLPVVSAVLLANGASAAEYYGDAIETVDPSDDEEFAPESYNPYLPESRFPGQRLFAPAPAVVAPVYPRAPVVAPVYPQAPVVAPATPLQAPLQSPVPGSFYAPSVVPGMNNYFPGLYNSGAEYLPGYFYPFNNSQGTGAGFW